MPTIFLLSVYCISFTQFTVSFIALIIAQVLYVVQ